jgi:cytochrome c biogenesis protein CcdA/thiol-disulfide isomerase/thioredoxin
MERKKDTKPGKRAEKKPENIPEKKPDTRPDNRLYLGVILLAIVILVIAVLFGSQLTKTSPLSQAKQGSVTVYYFYGDGCEYCKNVTPYVQSLRQRYPDVSFQILEVWYNPSNNATMTSMNARLNRTRYGVPEVFVGDVILLGDQEIVSRLEGVILDQKTNLTRSSQAPGTASPVPVVSPNTSISATYFYGEGCSHCEKVKPLIADLEARYPDLNLTRLEVYNNASNRQQLLLLSGKHGIQNPSLPIIFIGDKVLESDTTVINGFESAIRAEEERIAAGTPVTPANLTPADPGSRTETTPVLSPFMVVFAALVDSTNPCGLSVLVFLLISMAAAGDRKRILLVGGTYIAAMFLFHLLVGIGLFSAMALSGLTKPFSLIGGAIALVLGLVTLADVLRNRENFLLSIPESGKGMLGTYIRKATVPAAFVLGILAGILGFSCTGGIYISILGLMGRDMTIMAGLPWLILYNLVFILPLVLVTLLVAYGISPERADRWRTGNKRMVRVVIGLIMVALGLVILFGWFG